MNSDNVTVIGAISGLLIGVFVFIIKLWKDHTKLARDVLDIVKLNATASEKLSNAVTTLKNSTEKNTQATQQVVETTRQSRDTLSQLMIEVIKKKTMNFTLVLIIITLIGDMIPMVHFAYTQFRSRPEDESVKRMRRVMLSLHISTLIMLAYLTFLAWEGIIKLNFFGKWTDDLFLLTALLVLYANWYAFLEFRRFRLLADKY